MHFEVDLDSQNRRSRRLSFTKQLQRIVLGEQPPDLSAFRPAQPRVLPMGNSEEKSCSSIQTLTNAHIGLGNPGQSDSRNGEDNSNDKLSPHIRHEQSQPSSPSLDAKGAASNISRSEICVSPMWNKNNTPKKERRAIRRLEAERIELEKRLMKLEQAEQAHNMSSVRRESRRLTKKQPIPSPNSRASSVDPEESRSFARFSSAFSRHASRSRSRSRSTSITGDKQPSPRQSPGGQYKEQAKQQDEPAINSLSNTLPERFGIAISNELIMRNSALLPEPSKNATQTGDLYGKRMGLNVSEASDVNTTDVQTSNETRQKPGENIIHQGAQSIKNQAPLQDLDRNSFAATLKSDKRSAGCERQRESPLRFYSPARPHQADDHRENAAGPSRSLKTLEHRSRPLNVKNQASPIDMHADSSRTLPWAPRRHRRFTSSPLAGSYDRSDDTKSTVATTTPHVLSRQAIDNAPRELEKTVSCRPNSLSLSSSIRCQSPNNGGIDQALCSSNPPQHSIKYSPNGSRNDRKTPSKVQRLHSSKPVAQDLPDLAPAPAKCQPRPAQAHVHDTSFSHQGLMNDIYTSEPRRILNTEADLTPPPLVAQALNSGDKGGRPCRPSESNPEHEFFECETATSNVSVVTSVSQKSADYNTADEEAPDSRESQTSETPATKILTNGLPIDNFHAHSTNDVLTLGTTAGPAIPRSGSNMRARLFENFRRPRQLVGKLFVICCRCKFWHDMPSEVYSRLAFPGGDLNISTGASTSIPTAGHVFSEQTSSKSTKGGEMRNAKKLLDTATFYPKKAQDTLFTRPGITASSLVQCCWCDHYMSKQCCQGWTTVVHMRERYH